LIRAEKGLRGYTPNPAGPSPKPDRADEVLKALAGHYAPGDRISTDQIAAAAGVGLDVATAVRRWARDRGVWRYRKPDRRPFSGEDREWEGGDS
jgi:hypothetical protein